MPAGELFAIVAFATARVQYLEPDGAPEVGVAVGILFYLGTTIAASMYVLGAVERAEAGTHKQKDAAV